MQELEAGLKDAACKAGVATRFYRAGTMFCTYFTDTEVVDYETAKKANAEQFGRFFRKMLEQGIYLAPSQFEAGFLSCAHAGADIEKTVRAAFKAFKAVR